MLFPSSEVFRDEPYAEEILNAAVDSGRGDIFYAAKGFKTKPYAPRVLRRAAE